MKKTGFLFLLLFIFTLTLTAENKNFTVGVFCAADETVPDFYKCQAFLLGSSLAKAKYSLITGGGNRGLMNAVMNGFLSAGDPKKAFGVIPVMFKTLNKQHPQLLETNIIWTETLCERLQAFQAKSDVFVILPGGFGTLHELMDFLVAKHWKITDKKIILVNLDHYWDPLLLLFDTMAKKMHYKDSYLNLITVVDSIQDCLVIIQES